MTTNISSRAHEHANAPLIPSDGGIVELFRPDRLEASNHPAIRSLTSDPVTNYAAAVIEAAGGPTHRQVGRP